MYLLYSDEKMRDSFNKIIIKYFKEWNNGRKLILTSSSLGNIDYSQYFKDKIGISEIVIIKSENFINKKLLLEGVNIKKYDSEDGSFEKRFKILLKLITPSIANRKRQTIICCSDANINLIKAQFNSKRIKYALVANCKTY